MTLFEEFIHTWPGVNLGILSAVLFVLVYVRRAHLRRLRVRASERASALRCGEQSGAWASVSLQTLRCGALERTQLQK